MTDIHSTASDEFYQALVLYKHKNGWSRKATVPQRCGYIWEYFTTHTGDSTDTSGLSAEGIAEHVLLFLAEVLLVVVGVLSFIILATWFCDLGKHIIVYIVDCDL